MNTLVLNNRRDWDCIANTSLVVSSVLTGIGIFGAFMFMWRPLL